MEEKNPPKMLLCLTKVLKYSFLECAQIQSVTNRILDQLDTVWKSCAVCAATLARFKFSRRLGAGLDVSTAHETMRLLIGLKRQN